MLAPRQATLWSARDHGENFVDLTGPSEPPTPKEEPTTLVFFKMFSTFNFWGATVREAPGTLSPNKECCAGVYFKNVSGDALTDLVAWPAGRSAILF
jgi:hypothetical protein